MIGKRTTLCCDGCKQTYGMRDGEGPAVVVSLRKAAVKDGWTQAGALDRCKVCTAEVKARNAKRK